MRKAETSKSKLCHVRGGNKRKMDGSVMGQDFDWFLYGFCCFQGGRPFFTPAHDSPHPLPTSRIHLIRWKAPPASPHNTSGTPAQLVRCNICITSAKDFSNLFPTGGGGMKKENFLELHLGEHSYKLTETMLKKKIRAYAVERLMK